VNFCVYLEAIAEADIAEALLCFHARAQRQFAVKVVEALAAMPPLKTVWSWLDLHIPATRPLTLLLGGEV
jgi:hypothetical protein